MSNSKFLRLKEMQEFLGIGRGSVLKLCQEKPHGFPVIKVGNRYQADYEKLKAWKDAWYSGEFEAL